MRSEALHVAAPLAIAAVALVLAFAGSLERRSPPAHPETFVTTPEKPCPADVIAIVPALSPGKRVRDWEVTELVCTEPRQLGIRLRRGGARMTVTVAAKGAIPHSAPAALGGYELFYTFETDPQPVAETMALLEAVRVNLRDGNAPTPKSF